MRVLIVIELIIGASFLIVFVLADLARDLSRHSYLAPIDLDNGDDWDVPAVTADTRTSQQLRTSQAGR
jgi:hypothetical protein